MHCMSTAGIPLDSATTETKGTVLLKSAAELKASSPAAPRIVPGLAPRAVPRIVHYTAHAAAHHTAHGPGALRVLLRPTLRLGGGVVHTRTHPYTPLHTRTTTAQAYSNSEEESLERVIKAIADAGTKVIICGQAVGELALHFIEKYGMMIMKCPSKFELRRICRTTGANNLVRMEPPTEGDLGYCKHVHVKEIGSTQCTIFDHEQDNSKLATIVVRRSASANPTLTLTLTLTVGPALSLSL